MIDPAEKDAFYVLLLKTHMSAVFFRCVLFLVTHECIHLIQTKFSQTEGMSIKQKLMKEQPHDVCNRRTSQRDYYSTGRRALRR
jgi:hypothetical protein